MSEDYPKLPTSNKPSEVQTLGILTLISGIINILAGLGLTATVVIGTIGIGLICVPLTILPTIFGVFEILYAAKLLGEDAQSAGPSQSIAIVEIAMILFGNVISMAVGIVALVIYNNPNVRGYFGR